MKVAIIGAGRMGRRHIEVVRRLGLTLAGVFDISPESRNLAEREHGLLPVQLFDDAATLLARTAPDCVIVATTAPSHCEYTCLAAASGARFVLVEKPMAVSLAECDRMLRVCSESGTRLAVNHQMRFMEQYIEPKRLLNSDAMGGFCSATVIAGNFGLAMNATHYFEMFRYLTGERPEEIFGWFFPEKIPNPRGPEFEDRAGSVRLSTSSGKRLYIEAGADQGHGVQVIYAGRNGQLLIDEVAGTVKQVVREDAYRSLPTTRYGMPATVTEWKIEPADVIAPSCAVLSALLAGTDAPSGMDGRQAVEILVAAYQSAENGNCPVRLDGQLPRDRVFPWA